MTHTHESARPSADGRRSHLSSLGLERLAAADPSVRDPEAAAAHLVGCAGCRQRLAGLAADGARFAARDDLAARVLALQAALAAPRPGRWRWRIGGGTLLMAAAALVLVAARPRRAPDGSTQPDGRLKGGASVDVIRRAPDGRVDELASGEVVHPGDAIRFRVSSPTGGFVGVLGLDAAQVVTPYVPAGPALEALGARRPVVLDGSVVLDETLGPELVVAVFCPRPRPVDELVAEAATALARAGGDPRRVERATTCAEARFLLTKEPR